MSLWGKIAGALLLLSVLLVSCKDELSTLGFRNPIGKFKVAYKEIDIPTSVMMTDSLPTYNSPNFSSTQRLLVGKYVDPEFGDITATAFTQIRPSAPLFTLPDDATLISGELFLTMDYYHYGTTSVASNNFTVHELLDSLPPFSDDGLNSRLFFFNSTASYDPTVIASFSMEVNPSFFDLQRANNLEYLITKDTTKRNILTLRSVLEKNYAARLFLAAQEKTNDYTVFSRFRQIFKGLAIVPTNSQAIAGINPDNDAATLGESRIVLNYETTDLETNTKVTRQLIFGLFKFTAVAGAAPSYQIGFTNIAADRSGTPLDALPGVYQDLTVDPEKRYVQAGNPIVTKIDFGKYFEFSDTISTMSISAAELVITGIEATGYKPPQQLGLRILRPNNRFDNRTAVSALYAGRVAYDIERKLVFAGDNSEQFTMSLSESNGQYQYSGFLTNYLQLLYSIRSADSLRFRHYGIVPVDPEFGKSVNRLLFDKDNIKLRLYYTVPTKTQQQ
ncbi:MAG: DUF4270 family protein [Cyclobacteriaceae bacterium]